MFIISIRILDNLILHFKITTRFQQFHIGNLNIWTFIRINPKRRSMSKFEQIVGCGETSSNFATRLQQVDTDRWKNYWHRETTTRVNQQISTSRFHIRTAVARPWCRDRTRKFQRNDERAFQTFFFSFPFLFFVKLCHTSNFRRRLKQAPSSLLWNVWWPLERKVSKTRF